MKKIIKLITCIFMLSALFLIGACASGNEEEVNLAKNVETTKKVESEKTVELEATLSPTVEQEATQSVDQISYKNTPEQSKEIAIVSETIDPYEQGYWDEKGNWIGYGWWNKDASGNLVYHYDKIYRDVSAQTSNDQTSVYQSSIDQQQGYIQQVQQSSGGGQSNYNTYDQVYSGTAPYVGNSNSKKFHHSWCDSVSKMKPSNRVDLWSRDDAINAGYQPCKKCNP